MNTVWMLMLALSPSDIDVENAIQIAQLPEMEECQAIAKEFRTHHAFCTLLNIPHTANWEPEIKPYNLEEALHVYEQTHK